MSIGWYGRLLYDNCHYDQDLHSSTAPFRYQLLSDKYENNNVMIDKGPCYKNADKLNCKKCDFNKTANLEARWDSIGKRTDIESDLWIINRPNTRCANFKHLKCGKHCTIDKPYCHKSCPNPVVVNTRLCDRNIVPHNLSMPKESGLK